MTTAFAAATGWCCVLCDATALCHATQSLKWLQPQPRLSQQPCWHVAQLEWQSKGHQHTTTLGTLLRHPGLWCEAPSMHAHTSSCVCAATACSTHSPSICWHLPPAFPACTTCNFASTACRCGQAACNVQAWHSSTHTGLGPSPFKGLRDSPTYS